MSTHLPYHWSQELRAPIELDPKDEFNWSQAIEPWKSRMQASLRVWVSGMQHTSTDALEDLAKLRSELRGVALEMDPQSFLTVRAELMLVEKIFREGQIRKPQTKRARQALCNEMLVDVPRIER